MNYLLAAAFGCVVWLLAALSIALFPGTEVIFDFCGKVNVGGIMENGCTLGNATDTGLLFFRSTDPYSLHHMADPFVITMLFSAVVFYTPMIARWRGRRRRRRRARWPYRKWAPYATAWDKTVALASIWETAECLAATFVTEYFREVAGDSVIGDMLMAWLGASVAVIVLRYAVRRPTAILWKVKDGAEKTRFVLVFLAYFVAGGLSTFMVRFPTLDVPVGFIAYMPLKLLCLLALMYMDMQTARRGKRKHIMPTEAEVQQSYAVVFFFVLFTWAVALIPWYKYPLVVLGALVGALIIVLVAMWRQRWK